MDPKSCPRCHSNIVIYQEKDLNQGKSAIFCFLCGYRWDVQTPIPTPHVY